MTLASKMKACKTCKAIFDETKCPVCGSEETSEAFKGRVIVIDAEKSEIAQKLGIKKEGQFAVKLG